MFHPHSNDHGSPLARLECQLSLGFRLDFTIRANLVTQTSNTTAATHRESTHTSAAPEVNDCTISLRLPHTFNHRCFQRGSYEQQHKSQRSTHRMTTVHSQVQNTSHLDATVPEDVMELSSDVDRRFEAVEDIDLDLDLADTNQQYEDEEDEYMGEDSNSPTDPAAPKEQDMNTGNDDEMVDDGYVERSTAERSPVRDEDLEDAENTGAEIDEDVVVETAIESPSDPFSDLLDNEQELDTGDHPDLDHHEEEIDYPDVGDREYYQQPNLDENNPGETLTSLPSEQKHMDIRHDTSEPATLTLSQEEREEHDNKQKMSSTNSRDEFGPATQGTSQEKHSHTRAKQGGSRHPQAEMEGAMSGELESATAPSSEQQEQEENVALSEENFSSSLSPSDPETQIHDRLIAQGTGFLKGPIYVHPVIVVYQENKISLFPPKDQDDERDSTYFLEEEQLASDTIRNLLGACRSVLGESISGQDELAIDIGDLGLHISEVNSQLEPPHSDWMLTYCSLPQKHRILPSPT